MVGFGTRKIFCFIRFSAFNRAHFRQVVLYVAYVACVYCDIIKHEEVDLNKGQCYFSILFFICTVFLLFLSTQNPNEVGRNSSVFLFAKQTMKTSGVFYLLRLNTYDSFYHVIIRTGDTVNKILLNKFDSMHIYAFNLSQIKSSYYVTSLLKS